MKYHSGVETSESYCTLFDRKFIESELEKILAEYSWSTIKIHEEAYDGKQQKIKDTYGDKFKIYYF